MENEDNPPTDHPPPSTQHGEGVVDPSISSSIPKFIGDYEVLKFIGKGKFAVVYRARKKGEEQVVALKRISVDMMNEKAREKCLKEVRLLQSLDHPNIIRYMDSFITENDLIIVYEWAAAGDLKRQLRKAIEKGIFFEERLIWKYFSQIANAMQHMHEKRIMHRDLKPANIFLTLEGMIKVGDLGLSRELSEHTIQAHSKVGTPLYMSPEVLKGEGYDFKSDIWSLGCLLYELAMLKSPFKAEGLNIYILFEKISTGNYQPLPENFSLELRNLCYQMISTKPEDRPEIAEVVQIAHRMRLQTSEERRLKRIMSNSSLAATNSIAEGKTDGTGIGPSDVPNGIGIGGGGGEDGFGAKEEGIKEDEIPFPINRTRSRTNSNISQPGDERGLFHGGLAVATSNVTARPRSSDNPFAVHSNHPVTPGTHPVGTGGLGLPPLHKETEEYNPSLLPSNNSYSSNNRAVYRRNKPLAEGTSSRNNSAGRSRPNSGTNTPTVGDIPVFVDRGSGGLVSALESSAPAFALMDTVYSLLVVLGYPTQGKNDRVSLILPIHFAVNLSLYHWSCRQFLQMVEVIQWCVRQKLSRRSELLDIIKVIQAEEDAPLTTARTILRALNTLSDTKDGVAYDDELRGVTPTNLLPGYGYSVCLVLQAFLQAALRDSPPDTCLQYPKDALIEPQSSDEAEDPEEVDSDGDVMEDFDERQDGKGEIGLHSAIDQGELIVASGEAFNHSFGHIHGATNAVNAEDWKVETERVAPLLSRKLQEMTPNSWRVHVDQVSTLHSKERLVSSSLTQSVDQLQRLVRDEVNKLSSGERAFNQRPVMESITSSYASHADTLRILRDRLEVGHDQSDAYQQTLRALDETLEERLEALHSRQGGSEGGENGVPIVLRLRQATQTLREEIIALDQALQMRNHHLLQVRHDALRQRRHLIQKQRKKKKNLHFSKEVDEDDNSV